jgi:uncharacterized protein
MKQLFVFIICLFFFINSNGQQLDATYFKENYTKKEIMVPMRDGIKLFTSIYIPNDKSEKHPILMTRTPYSCRPYGEDKFPGIMSSYRAAYVKENYIIVFQDVRGRYMSEGEFEDVRPFNKDKTGMQIDEASDTYDAIEWLTKNVDNNNGNVGAIGTSYPGFYATQASLSNHPALKAVSPQAPVTDWFIGDDFHHNGAFFAMDGFNFYSSFGKPRPKPLQDYGPGFKHPTKDMYQFFLQYGNTKKLAQLMGDTIKFWKDIYAHPNYDNFWKARDARRSLYNVKPAMLWVGGLFDAEDCWGAWNAYKACEKQSPQTNSSIVMGPWYHGQWSAEGSYLGNVRFGSNTSDWYQQNIEIPFFNYHLKNKGSIEKIKEANVFFTGENNWKNFAQWPPKEVTPTNYFLDNNEVLSTTAPKGTGSYSIYFSNPKKPVPYTEDVLDRRTREYMTDDQRFAYRRNDVLSYKTEILNEDVTLAGPVIADLLVKISNTDADFVVKLIDVFPDNFEYSNDMKGNEKPYVMNGYQMLVRGEIMRGKFRKSFETPTPFLPHSPEQVKFELPDVAHTFKKGHRIMVQIQSSWFPLVDMNPQKFVNIYEATDKDYIICNVNILHNKKYATKIILPVLK